MCLNIVGERTQKCDRKNREWRWRQIKYFYRLHLDLVVKQLCCNATFRNRKLCCGNVFLHKNDETKNSSGLQFLFRANWNCLSRAGGGVLPLSPSWLGT